MSILAIVLASIIAYFSGWILTARTLFRRWHVHETEKRNCPNRRTMDKHKKNCVACGYNVLWWQDLGEASAGYYDDGSLVIIAVVQAVAWPLLVPGYATGRFIMRNPPLAPSEIKAKLAEAEEANRKLTDDLDLALAALEKGKS